MKRIVTLIGSILLLVDALMILTITIVTKFSWIKETKEARILGAVVVFMAALSIPVFISLIKENWRKVQYEK